MTNKPIKQARTITPDMIRDEKRMQALQQLAQQRTSFAVNILCNMVQGWNYVSTDKETAMDLVDISVKMADHLMEKLYGQTNEEKK